jgi:hypothetical protein
LDFSILKIKPAFGGLLLTFHCIIIRIANAAGQAVRSGQNDEKGAI